MDIREYLVDIILIIVLVLSSWWLLSMLGAVPLLIVAALLIFLSFAGFLVVIHHKVRSIERSINRRERMIKVNLEEISSKMAERYDGSIEKIEKVVEEVSKRVYR